MLIEGHTREEQTGKEADGGGDRGEEVPAVRLS